MVTMDYVYTIVFLIFTVLILSALGTNQAQAVVSAWPQMIIMYAELPPV